MKKSLSLLMLILILMTSIMPTALAETKTGQIDVYLHSVETKAPIAGAQIELYKVAYYDGGREIEFTSSFSDIKITKEDLIAHEADETIENYIQTHDSIAPFDIGTSADDGWLHFFDLSEGVYYLRYNPNAETSKRYLEITPCVVTLPYLNGSKNDWKAEIRPKCETDKFITVTVSKVWDDKKHEDVRPDEVTIVLLQDGEPFDTVQVREEDQWTYTWGNLSSIYEYSVQEIDVPKNYKVSITEVDSYTYVVKNKYAPSDIPATDDTTNLTGYILISSGAVLLIIGIIVFMIVRNTKKKEGKE